jgi:hypothetical protein
MHIIHLVKYITKNGPIQHPIWEYNPWNPSKYIVKKDTTYEKRQHRLGPQTHIMQTRPHHRSDNLRTNRPEQGVQIAGRARATPLAMHPLVRGDLGWPSYSLGIREQGAFFF